MTDLLNTINSILANEIQHTNGVRFCDTPAILQALGCDSLPIYMGQRHIRKVTAAFDDRGRDHGISPELLAKVPEALERPMFVFDSDKRTDTIVAVLDLYDDMGQPLMVCIHTNGYETVDGSDITVHYITSVYGKRAYGTCSQFSRALKDGRLLYFDADLVDNLYTRTGYEIKYNFIKKLNRKIIKQSQNASNTVANSEYYNSFYRDKTYITATYR